MTITVVYAVRPNGERFALHAFGPQFDVEGFIRSRSDAAYVLGVRLETQTLEVIESWSTWPGTKERT